MAKRKIRKRRKGKWETKMEMDEVFGPEPTWEKESKETIAGAMNWYNYMASDKEKKGWL